MTINYEIIEALLNLLDGWCVAYEWQMPATHQGAHETISGEFTVLVQAGYATVTATGLFSPTDSGIAALMALPNILVSEAGYEWFPMEIPTMKNRVEAVLY